MQLGQLEDAMLVQLMDKQSDITQREFPCFGFSFFSDWNTRIILIISKVIVIYYWANVCGVWMT